MATPVRPEGRAGRADGPGSRPCVRADGWARQVGLMEQLVGWCGPFWAEGKVRLGVVSRVGQGQFFDLAVLGSGRSGPLTRSWEIKSELDLRSGRSPTRRYAIIPNHTQGEAR